MKKYKQNISLFILTSILLTIGTIPYFSQNAYAATTAVTINGPDTSQSFGAAFTMRYTITSATNDATAGSITFTRTGGTADANSPHTYTMAAGDYNTDGLHTITRSTLQTGFGNNLVDGTIYTIVVSVTSTANGALTDTATSVTADFTAPTFTAAKTASNQITLTWSENVNSAADTAIANNPFTLGGTALTVTSTSALDGTGKTQILTLSGAIPDNASITISYDKDASNGDIVDSVTSTNQPNEAPDINNVSLSGATVSGGKGCDDCEAPTLGVDNRGTRLVSNGFTYNGHSVDVERFFTPYPLITANVGQANKAEFKIYENGGNDNIKHFSFAFGLGKDQVISVSKAMIELDIDHEGKETLTITDPENALENVKVETSTVPCGDEKISCLGITIEHTFRAPLDFNIVATDVWDVKRNAWQNYYNHGIEIIGESLNPPKEYDGIYKGHIYHLTETSKTTAVDEFGDTWTFNKKWTRDFKNTIIVDSVWNVMTRYNSNFGNYVDAEVVKAIDTLLINCPTCLKSFDEFVPSKTITYSERINKLDNPEIQAKMFSESERAQKTMTHLLNPLSYHQ